MALLVLSIMTTVLSARPDIMAVLEDRGYRSTAPRRAIIRILELKQAGLYGRQGLPGAPRGGQGDDLPDDQAPDGGRGHMQTEPDGRRPRYSLSRIEHHHHTVCIPYGNVGEFRAATVERI